MKGALLVNLGSPDSPSVPDVRRYLREFLMDGRVIDVAWPIRFCIVHFAILPFRPKQSAHAYQTVWTPDGSPLVVTSQNLLAKLRSRVSMPIELAMRYQNPSIPFAVERLAAQGVTELLLIPLFPHYAMSSYETAVERVREVVAKKSPGMRLVVQPPYYKDADYLRALVNSAKPYLDQGFDHLLFSYHGIPERQIKKSDPTGCHCFTVPNCCQVESPAHQFCYRAQCFRTTAEFTRLAGIPAERFSVAFQSRLGRDPWLRPYTDFELERLAKAGIKRILVLCPAFVSDCLETIEEIGMRGKETFLKAGGAEFTSIPCLNENPEWIKVMERMIADFSQQPARQESVAQAAR